MTGTMHHLTAHWVDEDDDATGIHHHLKEVWLDEDEAPITPLDVQQVVDTP
jgi:hypothetical protein